MRARHGESVRPPAFGTPTGLLTIAATALLMLMPVGEGFFMSLLIPHLVLVPLYFLTLRPVEGVGPVGAFAAGLSVDILTLGPLGVTAAAYLAVHMLLRRERAALMALPATFRLAGFGLAAGAVLAWSSLSMALLGPRGWPGPGDAAMAFAGLLAAGGAFATGLWWLDLRRARPRPGGAARKPRPRTKPRAHGPARRRP